MTKSLIFSGRSSKQNFNCTIIDHISNEIISNTPEHQDRPKIPQEKKKRYTCKSPSLENRSNLNNRKVYSGRGNEISRRHRISCQARFRSMAWGWN